MLLVNNCSAVKGLRFNQIIYSKFSLWDYKTNLCNSIYKSGFCVAKRQLLSVITKATQICVKPNYTVQIILSACLKIFLNFHILVNKKIAYFISLQVTVAYSPLCCYNCSLIMLEVASFPAVCITVLQHVVFAYEALTTDVTFIGFGSCVQTHVTTQVRLVIELFGA